MNTKELRHSISSYGGLANQADLARRWSISRPRMCELVRKPDFPEPVAVVSGGKSPLWAINEAEEWRFVQLGGMNARSTRNPGGARTRSRTDA